MNLACRRVAQFIVGVHTSINPEREEWEQLLDLARNAPADHKSSLIYTAGGAPSALQRRQLRDALGRAGIEKQRTAVLTESLIVRTAITALNLFLGGTLKAFPPSALDEAFLYMQVPQGLQPRVTQALVEMKQAVGLIR